LCSARSIIFDHARKHVAWRQNQGKIPHITGIHTLNHPKPDSDNIPLVGIDDAKRRLPTVPHRVIRENQHLAKTVGWKIDGTRGRRVQTSTQPANAQPTEHTRHHDRLIQLASLHYFISPLGKQLFREHMAAESANA
jgi:hypothetical protein